MIVHDAVCNQEVVRREGDPRGYADCLLRLAELEIARQQGALPLGVIGICLGHSQTYF